MTATNNNSNEIIRLLSESTRPSSLTTLTARGQVTLPVSLRRRRGFEEGDRFVVLETDDEIRIVPEEQMLRAAFAELGRLMRAKGLTVDDMIESGREIRGQLLEEMYGLSAGDE